MTEPRPYTNRWRKAALAYLAKYPLCIEHRKRGMVVPATVCDHIKPHRGDMKVFWDSSNWQGLCKHCHDSHKQRLEKSGVEIGCDTTGTPIDPNHHWNQGEGG